MKDSFLLPLALCMFIVCVSLGAIIGERATMSREWDSCIKYYNQQTVVEATKLCSAILERKQ